MIPADVDPELPVTLTDAARILGVPRSTLYRWAAHPDKGAAPVHYIRGTAESGRVGIYQLSEVAGMVSRRREERHADTAKQRTVGEL